MSEPSAPRAFDRRGFLQLIAGAVTALPAVAAAQTSPAPATPPAPAASAPAPPEHSGNEARLLTEVLRARYPDRFKEEQWASIVTDIDGDLGGAKRLRATKLTNGDEPDSTFRP
jgi:hypothetical protein